MKSSLEKVVLKLNDKQIVALYFKRDEKAIEETALKKYQIQEKEQTKILDSIRQWKLEEEYHRFAEQMKQKG